MAAMFDPKHGLVTIDPHDTEEAWLADRKRSFGGSDLPGLCGISPFTSPLAVIEGKRGNLPPIEKTLPMKIGHEVEPAISHLFSKDTGYDLEYVGDFEIHRNNVAPHMHVTPDRFYLVEGTRCVLEMKWVGHGMRRHWTDDDAPEYVQLQLQATMLCTGCRKGAIAALGAGSEGFAVYFYDFDPELAAAIIAVAAGAWEYVAHPDLEVPLTVNGRDIDTLKDLYPLAVKGKVVRLSDSLCERHMRIETLEAQQAAIKAELNEHKAHFMRALGDAEYGVGPDFGCSLKNTTRAAYSCPTANYRTLRLIHKDEDLRGLRAALPEPERKELTA